MNKDIHDIDELFRSVLEGHEEIPSAKVKENLETSLDKKDVEFYKRKYSGWKRVAILLLFLLAGFILYDSGIFQTGSGRKPITPKTGKPEISAKSDNIIKQKNNLTDDAGTSKKEEDKNQSPVDFTGHTNTPSGINGNINSPLIPGREINRRKMFPAILIDINNEKKVPGIQQKQLLVINDSLRKNNTAKNTNQKKAKNFKPYWLMTGFASYDRVNYKIDSDLPENITSIKHREIHEPSFSGGVLVTRQLTKHWDLQTGVVYSNTAIGISPQKMYAFQQPGGSVAYKYITSSGYAFIKPGFGPQPIVGDSLTTAEAKHTMRYISVPLAIKYTTSNKKYSFIPGAGIEANFITNEKVEVEIEDASNREIVFINKLNGARSFYWSITANTELRYTVNKNLSVSLRPTFRYAISSITKNNDVDTFPYNFGLGFGVVIKF